MSLIWSKFAAYVLIFICFTTNLRQSKLISGVYQPSRLIFFTLIEFLKVTVISSSGITILSEISVGKNDFWETCLICCRSDPIWLVKNSLKECLGIESTTKSWLSVQQKASLDHLFSQGRRINYKINNTYHCSPTLLWLYLWDAPCMVEVSLLEFEEI